MPIRSEEIDFREGIPSTENNEIGFNLYEGDPIGLAATTLKVLDENQSPTTDKGN